MTPGQETATEHFFIKQAKEPEPDLALNMPAYFGPQPYIDKVVSAIASLQGQGKEGTVENLVAYFEQDGRARRPNIKEGETIETKIREVLDLIKPETILANMKSLYEQHRNWYNREIPGFVVDKLYVLGADAQERKRGYVIKPRIEISGAVDMVDLLAKGRGMWLSKDRRQVKSAVARYAKDLKRELSQGQIVTLRKEIRKFVAITRNVMDTEGLVIDTGGLHNSNIVVSRDGHLRMIDTDNVFPARTRGGELDVSAKNVGSSLEALGFLADYLD